MIVGKIRVENFRGMSLGLYDENNRLHATAVTERADLQAICDGYNAFVDLQGGEAAPDAIDSANHMLQSGLIDRVERDNIVLQQAEEPRRGRGRPRKEQAANE